MQRGRAEPRRKVDLTGARRGAVIALEAGKTKISIRLDNKVLDHFRRAVDDAGGGSYQSAINAALLEHIERDSMLRVLRQVIREEMCVTPAPRHIGAKRKALA
jgi:uncharacterized protein (DUF4415 family)